MSSAYRSRAKALLKHKLESLYDAGHKSRIRLDLLISHRCFFRCRHCFLWKQENDYASLAPGEWVNLLNDAKEIYGSGVEVNIGGDGMALLNPNTIKIIKKSSESGFYSILNSNGFLINTKILKNLKEAGLNSLSISLDFLKESGHDIHRGIAGSFMHVMNILNQPENTQGNMQLVINCVIMKPNLGEILNLAKRINETGSVDAINFQAIAHPFGIEQEEQWYKKYSGLWPDDPEEVREIIDHLIDAKEKGYKIGNSFSQLESFKRYFMFPEKGITGIKCNIQETGIHVFSNGDVTLCNYMEKLGNLKDNFLPELLSSVQAKKLAGLMKNCSVNCHQLVNCKFIDETPFRVF